MKSTLSRLRRFLFGGGDTSKNTSGHGPGHSGPTALRNGRPQHRSLPEPAVPPLPASHMKVAAGSLQLLGLGSIRGKLGDEWERLSGGVFRLVESVLRRRLEVTDAYYRVDDENYLVLFSRLHLREAEFKARVIAEEIQTLILGETPQEHSVAVVSRVAEIDRGLLQGNIHSLGELLNFIRQGASAAENDAPGAAPSHGGVATHSEPGMDLDSNLSHIFQKTTVDELLQNCTTMFQPLVSLRRRLVNSYLTIPINRNTGRIVRYSDDPFLDRPEDLPFAIDRFMLGAGIMGLHRMLEEGQQSRVVVTVHFETLGVGRLREIYLSRIKDLPVGLSRYLGFAIQDVPVGTPASRVGEVLSYLRPLSSLQVLHVPLDVRLVDFYADVGCYGFSTQLSDAGDPSRQQRDLANFVRRAGMNRMETVLANVHDMAALHTAASAGIGVVWGDAVYGSLESPGGLLHSANLSHIPILPG